MPDTIKVRLQSSPPSLYPSAWACFTSSLRQGGVLSLYRGVSAPLLGAAIETSSLFWSYRIALEAISAVITPASASRPTSEKDLPFFAKCVGGAASGAFTSLLLTPIELVKCQMQVPTLAKSTQKPLRLPSSVAVVAAIFRHGGIRGFWHGQLGTLIRETGGSAAWFGSYEGVSGAFRTYQQKNPPTSTEPLSLPVWQQLLAGAAAGMSYNFVCFPADTIKSRMQTAEVGVSPIDSYTMIGHRRTFWNIGRALFLEQGVPGLYRGCGITVARAAPSSAFIFLIFEEMKRRCGS